MSGSFEGIPGAPEKGDGAGRMANAPPPDEFQFTLMYVPDAEMTFVSHALPDIFMLSIQCSFFAACPKTCRYFDARTKRDMSV
jgi:hypothetical protein